MSRNLFYLPNIDIAAAIAIVLVTLKFGPSLGRAITFVSIVFLSCIHLWEPINFTVYEKILFWFVLLSTVTFSVEFYRRQLVQKEKEAAVDRRAEVETLLAETARELKTLSESVLHMVWQADSEGRLIFVNKQWQAMNGEAVKGRKMSDFITDDRDSEFETRWNSLLAKKADFEIEIKFRAESGDMRWTSCRAVPFKDQNGDVIRWHGTLIDIHDHKLAIESVQIIEQKFRSTFDLAGIGIAHVLPTGRFAVVNKKLCSILGYSDVELMALTFQQLTHEDDLGRDLNLLKELLVGVRDSYQMEKRYIHRSKKIITVNLTVTLIRTAAGEPDYFISVIEDVTERRAAEKISADLEIREKAAIQASATKTLFLANMSHELRTPINGIIGMATLAQETESSSDREHYISLVEKSGKLLLRIVNDILDFSKSESGHLELEKLDFNLEHLVNEVRASMEPLASEKSVRLNCLFDLPKAQNYRGDPARIRQILYNLIGNALKFTSKGSVEIKVSSHKSDSCDLLIAVTDTGIGMSTETAASLFKPFVQGDSTTSRKFGGTGLGLSISKQLAILMNGKIWVESNLGSGSTFYVKIRLEVGSSENISDISSSKRLIGKKLSGKILLAEDNPVSLLVATKYLQKMGLEVVSAVNGLEVIEHVKNHEFDLILMDCQMPELDGYEATKILRTNERLDTTPVIALTANVLETERQKCLEYGMDDFLTKPIEREKLEETIERWLRNSRFEKLKETTADNASLRRRMSS